MNNWIESLLLLTLYCTTSVNSVTFECEFKMAGVPLVVIGDVYLCQPKVILDEDESATLEDVIGEHLESKTNDDVRMLNIYQQNMSFFPKNIAKFFPELKAINFHDSDLAQLSAEDFEPFPQLLYLGIRFTQLTKIESDLFKFTPNLKYITFAGSQIHHVGADLVTDLKDLTILDFQLTKCMNRIAKTPEQIAKLNVDLPNECHPQFKPKSDDAEDLLEDSSEDFKEFEDHTEL